MTVLHRGRHTRGFRICADEFGKGIAQIPSEGFHLGAGFRFLSILLGGDRVGDVLLHFLQLGERQRFDVVVSHAMPCGLSVPVSIPVVA